MKRSELMPILEDLKLAFMRQNFLESEQELELWLRMLQDLDKSALQKSAENYIKRNQFPPTIADIRTAYRSIKEQQAKMRGELLDIYGDTMSIYPGYVDTDESRQAWVEAVRRAREGTTFTATAVARALRNKTWKFIQDAEQTGTINEIPNWLDYLRGLQGE